MSGERVEVRRGAYHDSVALLAVTKAVQAAPGVLAAQVAMGTGLNLAVIAQMGFEAPDGVGPNDLVVAVRAADDGALDAVLGPGGALAAALAGGGAQGRSSAAEPVPAGTVGAALGRPSQTPGRRLVLVSVPGPWAFAEAMDAVTAGVDVMVFSDNVPLEQEVALKRAAAERGVLVMGPDCGTALVDGVGLGFVNVVAPGPVGVVAASGTGAQQLMCLLDAAGIGVRHCLGVGGRDLSAAVGGLATVAALRMLADDPRVEHVVLVGKPPAAQVEEQVSRVADALRVPVTTALLGPGRPSITEVAREVVAALGGTWEQPGAWPAPVDRPGAYTRLRGAFSGGTLCDEARMVVGAARGTTARTDPSVVLDDAADLPGVVLVDFGDDALTQGRSHPMIDGSLRAQWVRRAGREAAASGESTVVLLDVVLGLAAHPDPAAELVPALLQAREDAARGGADLAVVVSLCGTDSDPQHLPAQAERLSGAGASVHRSNAEAAAEAVGLLEVAGA